ncbi:response regulator transcription factor [Aquabacterium sp. J223]|uniref:response regulator transcription factor n=1 Tax=Aquabacterium sp. J223 TaxID=2898431 RepID=UPI0021AD8168|nr:response regulator transcription factor [Aquabacterium sp. J223]UUX94546.1 response regulator transcription factor [Aquabacterium sp. J223]
MEHAKPVRTVLADDHELVRSGLKLLLQTIDSVQVVDEARSGVELLEKVRRLRPDLVVTDISMPDMDGLAVLEALRGQPAGPRVLVVSMHDSPDFIRRAIQLGASGYIMKESSALELEHAVLSVMRGLTYLGATASRRLAETPQPSPEERLTARQLEILKLIASGHGSKEIGFRLGLSSKTVDVHRARIMERLGIGDVASLTLYAVRHGLVNPASPA